jgi:hypothetical protein
MWVLIIWAAVVVVLGLIADKGMSVAHELVRLIG